MRLELSGYIEGDLDGFADYIAQDNPRRAVTFIQDIRVKFHDIQHHPLIYQLRPDIGEEARMATIGSY
ncbi:MAG: type II toxin-antitoxin system RelE/ParE family toxin, partial [Sterolibacterium sp.]